MEDELIDLELLGLKSGEGETLTPTLHPQAPALGGETYPIEGAEADGVPARIEVSRTTSGHAVRLVAQVLLRGPCARCLESAQIPLAIEIREVDQPGTGDDELNSPYVDDGLLDATSWLHDGIVLAVPEQILCRPDCAGICDVCGVLLNEVDAAGHHHERAPDPRFAKLSELLEDEDR